MRIVRSPDPGPHRSYRDYKRHLQPLFRNRCAYCQTHEQHLGQYDAMEVDHFRPKGRAGFTHLEHAWDNLYYCCHLCNQRKSHHWPTDGEAQRGLRFVDPCAEDPDDHFRWHCDERREDYCWVTSFTPAGRYTIAKVRLNRDQLIRIRRNLATEERDTQEQLDRVAHLISVLAADVARRGVSAQTSEIMETLVEQQQRWRADLAELRTLRPFPLAEES